MYKDKTQNINYILIQSKYNFSPDITRKDNSFLEFSLRKPKFSLILLWTERKVFSGKLKFSLDVEKLSFLRENLSFLSFCANTLPCKYA